MRVAPNGTEDRYQIPIPSTSLKLARCLATPPLNGYPPTSIRICSILTCHTIIVLAHLKSGEIVRQMLKYSTSLCCFVASAAYIEEVGFESYRSTTNIPSEKLHFWMGVNFPDTPRFIGHACYHFRGEAFSVTPLLVQSLAGSTAKSAEFEGL